MSTGTYIYFIAPIGGGAIKIGCSSCPANRLATLMSWSPQPLELLAAAPGTRNDERAIHSAFLKQWAHHEWFRASPEIYALINRIRETKELPVEFRGTKQTRGLRHGAKSNNWSAEARARVSAAAKDRWVNIRACRTATSEILAFMERTGMDAGALCVALGATGDWLITRILKENAYTKPEEIDRVLLFIRAHGRPAIAQAAA